MTKKMGTFLFSLVLVAVALVERPAAAVNCVKPTCPSSTACCSSSECVPGAGPSVAARLSA